MGVAFVIWQRSHTAPGKLPSATTDVDMGCQIVWVVAATCSMGIVLALSEYWQYGARSKPSSRVILAVKPRNGMKIMISINRKGMGDSSDRSNSVKQIGAIAS